jgi:membrane associated rhomboid family serine protease
VGFALALANALAYALPAHGLGLAPALLDVALLAWLAPSLETRLGHARLAALCLLGALIALAVGAAGGSHAPIAFAAVGATMATVAGYVGLFPRARMLTLVLVPFLVTIVEVPAVALLGVWLGAQAYLGLAT